MCIHKPWRGMGKGPTVKGTLHSVYMVCPPSSSGSRPQARVGSLTMIAERAGGLQPVAGRLRETSKELWRECKRVKETRERIEKSM